MSVPVKYESQNNIIIRKYYQSKVSAINLETDICLKNMLQKNDANKITILDEKYTNSDIVCDTPYFGQNLSIDDIKCSISNPTAFCISSIFKEQNVR